MLLHVQLYVCRPLTQCRLWKTTTRVSIGQGDAVVAASGWAAWLAALNGA
jgi:hypothetical protein